MTSTVYQLFHVLCFGHASHTVDMPAYLVFCVQNRLGSIWSGTEIPLY